MYIIEALLGVQWNHIIMCEQLDLNDDMYTRIHNISW